MAWRGGREMSKEFQIALKKKKKERIRIEKENVKKGPTGQKRRKTLGGKTASTEV